MNDERNAGADDFDEPDHLNRDDMNPDHTSPGAELDRDVEIAGLLSQMDPPPHHRDGFWEDLIVEMDNGEAVGPNGTLTGTAIAGSVQRNGHVVDFIPATPGPAMSNFIGMSAGGPSADVIALAGRRSSLPVAVMGIAAAVVLGMLVLGRLDFWSDVDSQGFVTEITTPGIQSPRTDLSADQADRSANEALAVAVSGNRYEFAGSFEDGDAAALAAAEGEAWLELASDGTIAGHTGCREFSGVWAIEASSAVEFRPVFEALGECALLGQDEAISKILDGGTLVARTSPTVVEDLPAEFSVADADAATELRFALR